MAPRDIRELGRAADPTILSTSITLDPTEGAGATEMMAVDTADTVTAGTSPRADVPREADAPEADAPRAGTQVAIEAVSLRRFVATTAMAAILLGLLIVWTASHPGNHRSTTDVDVVVKFVAATLAGRQLLRARPPCSASSTPSLDMDRGFRHRLDRRGGCAHVVRVREERCHAVPLGS